MTEYDCVGAGYSIADPELCDLAKAYKLSKSKYWIALEGNIVIAGAGIAPLKGEKSIAELQKMYALPNSRGKGVGKKLMLKCLDFAEKMNFSGIYLETTAQMQRASKLYLGFGFEKIDSPLGKTGHFKCDHYYFLKLS